MRKSPRIVMAIAAFAAVYGAIVVRLAEFANDKPTPAVLALSSPSAARPDIVDRNGTTMATDLPASSIFAEPRRIVDVDEAVEKLTAALGDLDPVAMHRLLSSKSGFAWIKRRVTPAERQAVFAQGIPGIGFRTETQRLYPNGPSGAHLLGTVDVDNRGTAGIERWIDREGHASLRDAGLDFTREDLEPVALSIDNRVQHAVRDELVEAIEKFDAVAGSGLVLDVRSGEVIALVSLPDFDPNQPSDALKPDRINRMNVGTYEMGSTFKALNTAMALDSGRFDIRSVLDASKPLQFGRFRINDYRGEKRPLTVPEAFIHSSNIAMAKMAMEIGVDGQRDFLKRFGLLDRLTTELPETASPILPRDWRLLNTATISFGHGLAVTPLQASMAIAALVNGGTLIRPTFIKDAPLDGRILQTGLVSDRTGEALRYLMRLNAEIGSAKKANVEGFHIGGKTGTAEKVVNGRYAKDKVLTSFMGVVPADEPRYLILVMLDEPKGSSETYGFRTSGWNAVPVAGKLIERVVPMLGIAPDWERRPAFPQMIAAHAFGSERFGPGRQDLMLPVVEESWSGPRAVERPEDVSP
ncbi:penicillin-binding protein 2 [Fulvimarina sp. MAC8]|uniref:peptidoglycan D,D-transpeptidase FtsI family protein n=1 Tax=Fulvimarina sp. MAC8 TaxID=3162874 RepID=UPI0032ED54C0